MNSPPTSKTKAILVDLSQVSADQPGWIWPGRIPKNKVSILTGLWGLGKTFVLLDIADRVCSGAGFPDGAEVEPGRVMYVDLENGEQEIKARLETIGFVNWDQLRMLSEVEIEEPSGQKPGSHFHLTSTGTSLRKR